MKKIWFIRLLCAVMLFSAYAIAEDHGGTRITDALMQAGITEPVQLSQWGDYIWHTDANWSTMKVIGVIGDEWYHVWFPATGEYGFVRQSDLTEGNG